MSIAKTPRPKKKTDSYFRYTLYKAPGKMEMKAYDDEEVTVLFTYDAIEVTKEEQGRYLSEGWHLSPEEAHAASVEAKSKDAGKATKAAKTGD